ncbi:MAG: hypothetical protein HEEMFOPI_01121 [Holosporales bacterium]
MYHKNIRLKNLVTLILLLSLSIILFSVGFIRVNGGAESKPMAKKTVFKSLNDVFVKNSKSPEDKGA